MEAAAKRKRCGEDGEVDGKRREDDRPGTATATVTEDEVEEFFAILRRIQVAANYLKRRRDGDLTVAVLTAETEDSDGEDHSVKEEVGKSSGQDSVGKSQSHSTGLDLNLEPPSKETFV